MLEHPDHPGLNRPLMYQRVRRNRAEEPRPPENEISGEEVAERIRLALAPEPAPPGGGLLGATGEFFLAPVRFLAAQVGLSLLARMIGVAVAVVALLSWLSRMPGSTAVLPPATRSVFQVAPAPPDPDNLTFLILGVDAMEDRGRSDTILLLRLMLTKKKVHILSIPRDLYCQIDRPDKTVEDKLNHSYRWGGAELTRKSVERALGVKIDYYGVIDYDLFRKTVDLMGGIPMNVEKRYYYVDRAGGLKVDLFPGDQMLNGDRALQYVRFRHDAMGDLGRVHRQQRFIGAGLAKLKDLKVVTYLAWKLPSLLAYVTTDLPSQMALNLLWKVKDLTAKDLQMDTIPGDGKLLETPIHRNKLWFFVADKEKTDQLIREWFLNPDALQAPKLAAQRKKNGKHPASASPATPASAAAKVPVASTAPAPTRPSTNGHKKGNGARHSPSPAAPIGASAAPSAKPAASSTSALAAPSTRPVGSPPVALPASSATPFPVSPVSPLSPASPVAPAASPIQSPLAPPSTVPTPGGAPTVTPGSSPAARLAPPRPAPTTTLDDLDSPLLGHPELAEDDDPAEMPVLDGVTARAAASEAALNQQ